MTAAVRLPAERCYWALLEAPGVARPGELPPGLRAAFEEEVPVPGEDLHAVCAPLGDGRVLVCAAERDELAMTGPDVLSITPESIPDALRQGHLDPADLELLVGSLEPRPVRRARTRRNAIAIAAMLSCAGLVGLGLNRRATRDRIATDATEAATASVLESVAAASADALAMEVLRLRGSVHPEIKDQPEAEAAPALAALLAAWPAKAPSKPQSIAVNGSAVAVSLTVDGDAGPFLDSFKPPAGWALEEPRLNSAGSITRVNLTLRPAQGSRP